MAAAGDACRSTVLSLPSVLSPYLAPHVVQAGHRIDADHFVSPLRSAGTGSPRRSIVTRVRIHRYWRPSATRNTSIRRRFGCRSTLIYHKLTSFEAGRHPTRPSRGLWDVRHARRLGAEVEFCRGRPKRGPEDHHPDHLRPGPNWRSSGRSAAGCRTRRSRMNCRSARTRRSRTWPRLRETRPA
jgi:hypothetical protein